MQTGTSCLSWRMERYRHTQTIVERFRRRGNKNKKNQSLVCHLIDNADDAASR